jgi:hypothetical protein
MAGTTDHGGTDTAALRGGLREAGADLEPTSDLSETLGLILGALTAREHAQGGALYLLRDGRLELAAAHCDGLDLSEINRELVGQRLEPDGRSLVEFVARTGRTMTSANGDDARPGAAFSIHRDFDAVTGRRTESAMAIRLECPDGRAVGVLKLINRLSPGGKVLPFPPEEPADLHMLASIAAVAIDKSQAQEQLRWKHMETVLRLSAAAELRCGDMLDHVRRLSRLSTAIAKSLGLSCGERDRLKYASPMHDIGKTRLPDAILSKPGRLTEAESRTMRKHTLIGARILSGLGGDALDMAHDVALTHHERWDGSGYPHGQAGEDIPLSGRIVAVADTFDALVTKRSYRSSYPIGTAFDIVRTEKEKLFDPDVTRAFLQAEDHVREIYRA